MKAIKFLFFISIFLLIYLLANYYIFMHGIQSIPASKGIKALYITLFTYFSLAYMASRLLEHSSAIKLHHVLYYSGSLWFAALLYFFIAALFFDFVRIVNLAFHFLPDIHSYVYANLKLYGFVITVLIIVFILGLGYRNAANPRLRQLDISIKKSGGKYKALKIAMVSDIHLGSLINKNKVATMVANINGLHPDIILMAGDVLDEIQEPIFREDIGEPLQDLKAPLGVYAITGNHEYIGGVNAAVKYLESKNIQMLRDTVICIDNSFYLAGREDRDSGRFTGRKRKSLNEIIENIDRKMPLIVMDHQPFKLEEAVSNDVDLQLSGHTHNGQFWPLNHITRKIFDVSWGYKLKANTHIYVSCGYGTWGPPVRSANTPELVLITLSFV